MIWLLSAALAYLFSHSIIPRTISFATYPNEDNGEEHHRQKDRTRPACATSCSNFLVLTGRNGEGRIGEVPPSGEEQDHAAGDTSLYSRGQGTSPAHIARDPWGANSTLSHWCGQMTEHGSAALPGSGHQTPEEEEIRLLNHHTTGACYLKKLSISSHNTRYQPIADHLHDAPIRVRCRTLEVSARGYDAWKERPVSEHEREDARIAAEIQHLIQEHCQVYGSPRMHAVLAERGIHCGRKRVVCGARGRRAPQTTRDLDVLQAITITRSWHPFLQSSGMSVLTTITSRRGNRQDKRFLSILTMLYGCTRPRGMPAHGRLRRQRISR